MFRSLSSLTPFMWGGMILFMVVFMALLMFMVHTMRTNHRRRRGASSHIMPDIVSVINWGIKLLLRLGVRLTILGQVRLLTVRGRKTGKARTLPVDLYEHQRRRFLIATHGEGNWVYNLRAAGEGILSLGRKHQTFTAVALPPEEAGLVIKEVLGPLLASQGIRGNALRQHFGVTPNASLNDFIKAAHSHPVFEIRISQ